MGLLSKLFGFSKDKPEAPQEPTIEQIIVPETATPREVITLAVTSVVEETHGNCATIEAATDSNLWVQIMDSVINCHYPHQEAPDQRFPELCTAPIVAGLDAVEVGSFMTVTLHSMDSAQISEWIERYFSHILLIDLNADKLTLRMESL